MTMAIEASTNRIAGLEALLREQGGKGPAPVEKWNPPYCGDIGMKIRSDGVWLYQGSPIGRMPLVKLFARVLRKDGDGRHYLVTPAEKVDVDVADAPFLAVEMDAAGETYPAVYVRRSGEIAEVLLPPHVLHDFRGPEHERELRAAL